jgi:hypothetical protein
MSQEFASEWFGGAQLARFFNVSAMTIWRWEHDPRLNFPKPTIINNRKYRSRDEIDRWMRDMATAKAGKIEPRS